MTKNGAEHPEVIDLVSENDSDIILIIIQTESLDEKLLLKMQDKINNYLSFAENGELQKLYPDAIGKNVVVRLDMYEKIDPAALDFFEKVKALLADNDVKFTWAECEYWSRV